MLERPGDGYSSGFRNGRDFSRSVDRHQNDTPSLPACALVGAGRLGTALAGALRAAGVPLDGPLGRGADGAGAEVVLLCVPDAEIEPAAAAIVSGPLIGHCSGALGLDVLGEREAFSLHPLMTVTGEGAEFADAGAAVDGTSERAIAVATELAQAVSLRPIRIAPEDRAAYHAAASIASNFLVTLEAAAERLAATAGADREVFVPLVRATVENWAALGPQRALTGPVARGDEATVARQRAAIEERTPELLDLFDALVTATRELAGRPEGTGTDTGPSAPAGTVASAPAGVPA
jgi:predicted short-subunit dehydrogenase-like oxidoreductase (DUF2520 family)